MRQVTSLVTGAVLVLSGVGAACSMSVLTEPAIFQLTRFFFGSAPSTRVTRSIFLIPTLFAETWRAPSDAASICQATRTGALWIFSRLRLAGKEPWAAARRNHSSADERSLLNPSPSAAMTPIWYWACASPDSAMGRNSSSACR